MSAEEPKTVVKPEAPSNPPPPPPPPPQPTEAPKDVAEEKGVIPPAPPPEEKPDDSKALAVVESILTFFSFFVFSFLFPFSFFQLFEVLGNFVWLVRKGRKIFCFYAFCSFLFSLFYYR